jgi:tRNA nucleotidyltransferase (CCA-adding enzyme)
MPSLTKLSLPREVIFILDKLQSAGHDAYIVGGAVRDLIRSASASDEVKKEDQNPALSPYSFDWDLTTQAKPEEIKELFLESFYENDFGTVSITLENLWEQMRVSPPYKEAFSTLLTGLNAPTPPKLIDLAKAKKVHVSLQDGEINQEEPVKPRVPNFEITTYRSKELYEDGPRKPSSLSWGESLTEDLNRRDFTINAMALSIPKEVIQDLLAESNEKDALTVTLAPEQFEIIDQHGSLDDLHSKQIKTVGDPDLRFKEDALRMLRAIRFAVQLNFQIEDQTLQAITRNSGLLTQISMERIRDEFLKMLASSYPKKAIELLDETQLLPHILPELLQTKAVGQGGHHTTDVWTHALDALQACPSLDPVVKLSTLLHDISKPETSKEINGQITAYNHEVVGSRVAKQVARRLKLSNIDSQRVFILTRFHMFHYQPQNSDASIRRFMRKVGLENIDDILDLREGDRLGSGARKTSWRLEEMKQRMIEQLNQPLDATDLAISGHDLIKDLGMKPGPKIGEVLKALLEKVLDEPEINTKDSLLKLANNIDPT